MLDATAEPLNCSIFLKNLENHFCNSTYRKNFAKHIENLPHYLSEKFIGDNLSITDIALRNWDLSIIGIAQGFFEIIEYQYRFSAETFVVPITGHCPTGALFQFNTKTSWWQDYRQNRHSAWSDSNL